MIYLDNGATTKVAPEVLEAMLPWFCEKYGNPSAVYTSGQAGKKAVNEARRKIAAVIGAGQEEIFFTSGGTESDNWALKAAAESRGHRGRHIVTTKIEHHAVLHTCRFLERQGFEVTYLDVDREGTVDKEALKAAIRTDTILISVMYANNEIGTIEPVREIGEIARERGILFHTDAVQAFGQIPINAEEMKIDLLSASAHKLNGPKGVGMLYVRPGVELGPFMHGGGQERGFRAGTENVPGIVGFGAAADRALSRMTEKAEKERALRDHLIRRIENEIPYCRLNGHREKRLPGNVNFSFRFVQGEALAIAMDMKGVCVSSGSACTVDDGEPSHVLLAAGLGKEEAHGALRMTVSAENTAEETDRAVDILKQAVCRLREMSSAYRNFTAGRGTVSQG